MLFALAAAAALFAPAALAAPQSATARATEAVDPARLVKARNIVEQTMPTEQRDAMFAQMLDAMMANLMSGMMQGNPGLSEVLQEKPAAAAVFADFITRQKTLALEDLKDSAPEMIEAIAGAYAKRFNLAELTEIEAFVRTPTGARFLQSGTQLFSDPGIAAWQAAHFSRAQQRQSSEVRRLLDDLKPILESEDDASGNS
ncbi:DUF2059 domain-containing protein [Sphingomonas suaedae]|uniref:DUF2059 domain-containing protein n=2 Tax=Sphingomonas suaedae TaxID=2599297 RepID=A0A518RH19_9SPHN|nr:DUF2059 domain-containing protein [Sphingomonas suaedae]